MLNNAYSIPLNCTCAVLKTVVFYEMHLLSYILIKDDSIAPPNRFALQPD